MVPRKSPIGFTIYDLLTRITPGAIFLISVFGSLTFHTSVLPQDNTTILLIGFLILSLLMGEAINYLASLFFTPPTSFKLFLHEQGVDVNLSRLDRLRQRVPKLEKRRSYVFTAAGEDFWKLFTTQFGIDRDYTNDWDIYNILLGYMEPRLSPTTQRQQTVFHFVNNTVTAILFGLLLVLGRLVIGAYHNNLSEVTIIWSVIATFISVFLLYLITALFGYQESNYVSNLIIDYYVDRVEEGAVNDLDSQSIQTTLDERSVRDL